MRLPIPGAGGLLAIFSYFTVAAPEVALPQVPQLATQLGAWPPVGRWYTFAEADLELGLPNDSINALLNAAKRSSQWKEGMEHLQQRGVWKYRVKSRHGRQWWIAFAGVGSDRPHFDETAEEHTFNVGGSSEGEDADMPVELDLPGKPTSPDTAIMKQRVAWVQGTALQVLMSTPTQGLYLTVPELSRWTGVAECDLRGVLQVANNRQIHWSFLRTFGITSRMKGNEPAWHLMGCGNVVSLGKDHCMELLSTEPPPIFWDIQGWVLHDDKKSWSMKGDKMHLALEIADLVLDVDRSLECWDCSARDPRRQKGRFSWHWMLLESAAALVLTPDAPDDLGIKFECLDCNAIHIGHPLPPKSAGGARGRATWSMKDLAVKAVHDGIPSWLKKAPAADRAARRAAAKVAEEAAAADAAAADAAAAAGAAAAAVSVVEESAGAETGTLAEGAKEALAGAEEAVVAASREGALVAAGTEERLEANEGEGRAKSATLDGKGAGGRDGESSALKLARGIALSAGISSAVDGSTAAGETRIGASNGAVSTPVQRKIRKRKFVSESAKWGSSRSGVAGSLEPGRCGTRAPERIYAAHETDFLNLAAQVHLADVGCVGPLTSDGAQHEKSNKTGFRCVCTRCGADFGRLRVGGTQSLSTILGVLLAGSTHQNFSAALEYADQHALSESSFNKNQKPILREIDRLFEEHLAANNDKLRSEPGRKKWVPVEKVYILHHKERLLAKMQGDCGLKFGDTSKGKRGENLTIEEVAVNLLRCARQKCVNEKVKKRLEQKKEERINRIIECSEPAEPPSVPVVEEEPVVEVGDWFPDFEYNKEEDKVLLTTLHVSLDASFRHRGRRAQGASVIQSVELTSPNEKDRLTVVHDLVSISRRCSKDVPLSMVCTFARDGERCPVHGFEGEWLESLKDGDRRTEALQINCFSSGTIRFPLAAQNAEGVGANIICLRTQLAGFWVTRISHDQDAHIGKIFRWFFNPQECYDRAHIAKNLKKNIAKWAKGNGDRVVRNFANAVVRARTAWLAAGGDKDAEWEPWMWPESFIEYFNHMVFHLQGNHSFCSKDCKGVDATAFEGLDGEMLVAGAAGDDARDDFFADAMDSSEESADSGTVCGGISAPVVAGESGSSNESESEGRGGMRIVGDEGAQQTQTGDQGLPKVSLDACKASAETTPSLVKSLTLSGQLFQQKENAWVLALCRTGEARKVAAEGEAGDKQLELFQFLLAGIEATLHVCGRAKQAISSTLSAVDRAIVLLHPVPSQSIELPQSLGEIVISSGGQEPEEMVHAPATLLLTSAVKGLMLEYKKEVKNVARREAALRVETCKDTMVTSTHLEQENTGTLRHLAWRETAPTAFFSPCANRGGETLSAKRRCSACSAQILINTACLRAFCFCVLIGTNALESFNGSIAAMVPKCSDFFVSHVGRAQLALLKRCYPGGFAAVVDKLRTRLGLPLLTEAGKASTLKQQRKANNIRSGSEVWSRAAVSRDGDAKLARRNKTSVQQAVYQKRMKSAMLVMECAPRDAPCEDVAGEGKGKGKATARGNKTTRSQSRQGVRPYDASGSNAAVNEAAASNELPEMVVTTPATVSSKKRECRTCAGAGLTPAFMREHSHFRSSKLVCPRVQKAWVDSGGQPRAPTARAGRAKSKALKAKAAEAANLRGGGQGSAHKPGETPTARAGAASRRANQAADLGGRVQGSGRQKRQCPAETGKAGRSASRQKRPKTTGVPAGGGVGVPRVVLPQPGVHGVRTASDLGRGKRMRTATSKKIESEQQSKESDETSGAGSSESEEILENDSGDSEGEENESVGERSSGEIDA